MKLEDYMATWPESAVFQKIRGQLDLTSLTERATYLAGSIVDPAAVCVVTDVGLYVYVPAEDSGTLTPWRDVSGFRLVTDGKARFVRVVAETPAMQLTESIEDDEGRDHRLIEFAMASLKWLNR